MHSLRYKEAQIYYAEYQESLDILEDGSVKDVYFETYTYCHYLLFFRNITNDLDNRTNCTMSSYYNKDSVTLIEK